MNSTGKSEERLDFWTCFFLSKKLHKFQKLSTETLEIIKGNNDFPLVYKCKSHGAFLSRRNGDEEEFYSGSAMCIALCSLILFVGVFGVIANILNVIVLKRAFHKDSAFKDSLVVLAGVDLILCFVTVFMSFFTLSILENWNRGGIIFTSFIALNHVFFVCRTASIYITILITVERFLVVQFPVKSRSWMTRLPCRIALIAIILMAFLINLHWMFKAKVVGNKGFYSPLSTDPDSLRSFPYITKRTEYAPMLNDGVKEFLLALNYVVPFPVLLLFNAFLYYSIYSWNKSRAILSRRQKRDINAAKMFSLVVIILLSCHFVSCVVFYTTRVQHLVYRELIFLQSLCVLFGAAINFLVYFCFNVAFKVEFFRVVTKLADKLGFEIKTPPELSGMEISMVSSH